MESKDTDGLSPEGYHPCVGDIVMKGHPEGHTASCGIVTEIWTNDIGEHLYIIQMNLALVYGKGPEMVVQDALAQRGFHPATKEEWQQDLLDAEGALALERAKWFEKIKQFID